MSEVSVAREKMQCEDIAFMFRRYCELKQRILSEGLFDDTSNALFHDLKNMKLRCKDNYLSIDAGERAKLNDLMTDKERFLFFMEISDGSRKEILGREAEEIKQEIACRNQELMKVREKCKHISSQIEICEKEISFYKNEYERIKESAAYRMGYIITYIPRKIKEKLTI